MNDEVQCPQCGTHADARTARCPQCGTALSGSKQAPSRGSGVTLEAGRDLGPYRLARRLGRGGFAEVWEAENRDTGRRVALKVLTELRAESTEALERFQREGRLAASLSHPRCVYVFGAEEIEGVPVISMELMPGGTLADRLKQGPLPTGQAVDYVLNVLDGLDAGQRLGIIHRDVKPSNCFLDDKGGARVGDFGISKSLEADSRLTATGSFLGTPDYASPEQVSGEPLDLRADLYSVGVVLYELLTGTLPFAGTNASQVLAQVLTKEPIPFSQHRVMVPRGLQRVVLRLLAKQKQKRFPGYEPLRAALAPYSSRGFRPAGLLRRFAAITIDLTLFTPFSMLMGTAALGRGVAVLMLGTFGILAVQSLYFGLMEGLLGRSLGKWLLRLRVVGTAGPTAGLGKCFLRAGVFLLIYQLPNIVVVAVLGVDVTYAPAAGLIPMIGILVAWAILASTMRRANGFAALHEVASRTRVVDIQHEPSPAEAPQDQPLAVQPGGPMVARLGPYRTVGTVWERDGEALVIGHDDVLKRDVWIHLYRDGAHAPPLERLRVRREGSLPWLQRSESDGWHWDAYGVPRGAGLVPWVREQGSLSWKQMRPVIDSLARELTARFTTHGTAGRLSLAHLWVEDDGRAVLLDFPTEPEASPNESRHVGPEDGLAYLRRATTFGFERQTEASDAAPRVPMPEHARIALARLYGVANPVGSVEEFATLIIPLNERPVEVTQVRRLGSLGVPGIVPAFLVTLVMVLPLMFALVPPWYQDLSFRMGSYRAELDRIDSLDASGVPVDSAMRATARSIWIVLSAAKAEAELPGFGNALLNGLEPDLRALVDSAAAMYPDPDTATVARAREWLAGRMGQGVMAEFGVSKVPETLKMSFYMLGFLGIAGVVLAFVFRGPVLLHAFGITVQRTDGTPAERWRCFLRSLLAWFPLILMVVARPETPLSVLLIAIALLGAGWSAFRPARGPADLLVGTVLVPK